MEQKTNETASTRRKAMVWWNSLNFQLRQELTDNLSYEQWEFQRTSQSLTGREIEEIYNKEVLEPKRQKEWQESQVNCRYTKPNAKEFKQFDESLFKAYTDKLPHNEVGTMIGILSRRLNKLELTGVIEDLKVALNYK